MRTDTLNAANADLAADVEQIMGGYDAGLASRDTTLDRIREALDARAETLDRAEPEPPCVMFAPE